METPTQFDSVQQMAQMQAQLSALHEELKGIKTNNSGNVQDVVVNPATQNIKNVGQDWDSSEESLDNFLFRVLFPNASANYLSVGEGKEIYQLKPDGYFTKTNRTMLEKDVLRFLQKEIPKKAKAQQATDTVKMLIIEAEIPGDTWAERVNPDGYLNCTNGVLKISADGVELLERGCAEVSNFIFLDKPVVRYDPDASREHAEQAMFQSLEGESRELYQRVMGSSLNVAAVRQKQDRIPALNSPNTSGANGKSLNNGLIARIHGRSAVAQLGLEYFKSKSDDPARNEMWMLAGKKVNLPAESESNFNASNLALLKAVVTGDSILTRGLFKDAFDLMPRCVLSFSLNSGTILNGTTESTTTRWRLLDWPYAFVNEPDESQPHQKKGDPRLNTTGGDFSFIDEHVLPGYLNLLIDGFNDALEKGFPNVESAARLEDNAAGSDHVAQFLSEMGLKPVHSSAAPFASMRDIHQLYLFWLKFSYLNEDDERRDAITMVNHSCKVSYPQGLKGAGNYNDAKHSIDALATHLKHHKQVSIWKPTQRVADKRQMQRKEWCWLAPATNDFLKWSPELTSAVANLTVDSIVVDGKELGKNVDKAAQLFDED